MIIAIDGPAAAGKGTLARRLAAATGLAYLDTGLLYRAVGRRVLDAGGDPGEAVAAEAQARALSAGELARTDLRGAAADQAASLVAAVPGVRAALLAFQRGFATGPGAVLDGRDIGTVVFPDAAVKLFVTASLAARAERRWRERPDGPTLARVTAEMAARDALDEQRAAAPLRPAPGAVVLDTTALDPDAVFAAAMAVVLPHWQKPGGKRAMTLETVSRNRCFGGTQFTYRHQSRQTGTAMRFAAFVPPQAEHGRVPVVWYLSGLTCTEENVTAKAGAQRVAAELGLLFIAPDTSPRGEGVPDDAERAYDFGLGAGFYVDATQAPWAAHYRMRSYIEAELPALVAAELPADMARQSITGHSMGGHGAITIALRNPGRFAAVSAFAPIASPLRCPWGEKALGGYLGADRSLWREYDSCALIEDGARLPGLLVDQGTADDFLTGQLKPELLEAACAAASIPLTLRRQAGYDHSYFFMATFMEDHLRYHAAALT